jgi:hypothetical protein
MYERPREFNQALLTFLRIAAKGPGVDAWG